MANTLDHALEICKLLKLSPRRDGIFEKLKQEITPHVSGLRTLCLTRWTVRAPELSHTVSYLGRSIRRCKAVGVESQNQRGRIKDVRICLSDAC